MFILAPCVYIGSMFSHGSLVFAWDVLNVCIDH